MGEMSDYIAGLEAPDRDLIERIRARAVSLVPEAVEGRSYGMPALRYRDSPLLSLMATKDHIGLYPFSPEVVSVVEGELDGFSWSKGTIRFTADAPAARLGRRPRHPAAPRRDRRREEALATFPGCDSHERACAGERLCAALGRRTMNP